MHGAPFDPIAGRPYLHRWTVDMASKGEAFSKVEKLSEWIDEFPRIDDRFTGIKARYTWGLEMDMRRPCELKGGSAVEMSEALGRIGFRRSQNVVYRPSCDFCQACVSMRVMALSSENISSAKALVSSVLPTPVGPRNRKDPSGLLGS